MTVTNVFSFFRLTNKEKVHVRKFKLMRMSGELRIYFDYAKWSDIRKSKLFLEDVKQFFVNTLSLDHDSVSTFKFFADEGDERYWNQRGYINVDVSPIFRERFANWALEMRKHSLSIQPKPVTEYHRTGHLFPITAEEISSLLGFEPNMKDSESCWGANINSKDVVVWNYKGSERHKSFCVYGPTHTLEQLFGSLYHEQEC